MSQARQLLSHDRAPSDKQRAAQPALGAVSARNVPKLPGPRILSGKRSYGSYTDLDPVSALTLAACVGIRDAARTLSIPERTLRDWVDRVGGIAGLSEEVRKALGVTQYALAIKACEAIASRIDEFTPSELLDVVKALGVGAVLTRRITEADDKPASTQVLVMVGDSRTPLTVDVGDPSLPATSATASPPPKQLPASTD